MRRRLKVPVILLMGICEPYRSVGRVHLATEVELALEEQHAALNDPTTATVKMVLEDISDSLKISPSHRQQCVV